MIIDEDIYLEHYGVKGMKWGVRKDRSSVGDDKKKQKKPLTPAERRKRTERNIKYANRAVLAAFAAIYIAAVVADAKMQEQRPNSSYRRPPPNSSYRTRPMSPTDIINKERNLKVEAIKRTHKEGHIDKEQMDAFLKSLNARYDRKVQEAKKT